MNRLTEENGKNQVSFVFLRYNVLVPFPILFLVLMLFFLFVYVLICLFSLGLHSFSVFKSMLGC